MPIGDVRNVSIHLLREHSSAGCIHNTVTLTDGKLTYRFHRRPLYSYLCKPDFTDCILRRNDS